MKFNAMSAYLAMALGATGSGGGAPLKPAGHAAKSPELQQELIEAAKAKRERRAAKRVGSV